MKSIDSEVAYDGETVHMRKVSLEETTVDGRDQHGRRTFNFNLDFIKSDRTARECSDPHGQEINLSFSALTYSVKQGLRRETKTILNNLHGEFLSRELTAIMGPSGAGKSTLMDVLAGFTTSGVEGFVKTNGSERDLRIFARQSCYIMQDDELCPLLTVHEALTLAAFLKLGPKTKGKQEKVKKLLESLGLYNCRKVMSSKLSGGQKKRLAIALELISDPPIMFFDEPTSGLDSSTSKQCISLLKGLAESGRTVICTIHQPSASLFEMFDHVYAMRNGRCIYSGGTEELVPFLSQHGLKCPQYHNPADFMLEIASMSEHVPNLSELTKSIDEGKCVTWRKRQAYYNEKDRIKEITGDEKLNTKRSENSLIEKNIKSKVDHKPNQSKLNPHRTYPTSFWVQFSILLLRNFKKILRDAFFTYLQLFIHIVFGVLIGTLFYNIGNDAAFVSDNFSLLFFCIMMNMFTSYSAAISQYPQELPILVREHFNKWYSLKSYFLATTISGLPVQVSCSLLYISIVYYMTSQPPEVQRFVKCTMIVLLVAFVGQGIGHLVTSTLNVQNASIFGALLIAPFMLFSGYFVLIPDSPYSMKWLFHMSYFKYALEGVMIAIFGNHRSKMNCSEDYCHFIAPGKFLRQIGMESDDYWFNFWVLLTIGLFLRIVTYYSLRFDLILTRPVVSEHLKTRKDHSPSYDVKLNL